MHTVLHMLVLMNLRRQQVFFLIFRYLQAWIVTPILNLWIRTTNDSIC